MADVIQAWASLDLIAVALWVAWVEYRRLVRSEVGR